MIFCRDAASYEKFVLIIICSFCSFHRFSADNICWSRNSKYNSFWYFFGESSSNLITIKKSERDEKNCQRALRCMMNWNDRWVDEFTSASFCLLFNRSTWFINRDFSLKFTPSTKLHNNNQNLTRSNIMLIILSEFVDRHRIKYENKILISTSFSSNNIISCLPNTISHINFINFSNQLNSHPNEIIQQRHRRSSQAQLAISWEK